MVNLRDIKRRGARDLHDQAKVSALYFTTPGAIAQAVSVRIHTKFDALGLDRGAQLADTSPKIIIDTLEISHPATNALISVELGEVYRLGNSQVADGEFVKVSVARLSQTQINNTFPSGQPVPQ